MRRPPHHRAHAVPAGSASGRRGVPPCAVPRDRAAPPRHTVPAGLPGRSGTCRSSRLALSRREVPPGQRAFRRASLGRDRAVSPCRVVPAGKSPGGLGVAGFVGHPAPPRLGPGAPPGRRSAAVGSAGPCPRCRGRREAPPDRRGVPAPLVPSRPAPPRPAPAGSPARPPGVPAPSAGFARRATPRHPSGYPEPADWTGAVCGVLTGGQGMAEPGKRPSGNVVTSAVAGPAVAPGAGVVGCAV